MSSSSSHAGTSEMSYMVFGPFGGVCEEYQRFRKINGIKAFHSEDCIESIDFKVKDGTSTEVQRGSSNGWKTFEVRLREEECITHFLGYFKKKVEAGGSQEKIVITYLTFETNQDRTLGPITTGENTESGTPFPVLPAAGKIIEFSVGKARDGCVASIRARVELTSTDSPTVKENSVKSIGPFGGGRPWNDGIFTGVKEIYLHLTTNHVISYIRFVYDFGGKKDVVVMHPEEVSPNRDEEKVPFEYPSEYLTSISGHTRDNGSIQALEFYTNLRSYEYGDPKNGKYFWHPSTGANKIVGFHGASGTTLNSIGVYVKPISPPLSPVRYKPIKKGSGGDPWDDGQNSHVTGYRVTYSRDNSRIESITFMYDRNGSSFEGLRRGGRNPSSPGVWTMLNFPEERLKYLTGYWRQEEGDGPTIIHNLHLRTTDGRRATRVYAEKFQRSDLENFELLLEKESGKKLDKSEKIELKELKKRFKGSEHFQIPDHTGMRISGFFGRAGTCLNSIGAYVGSY